MTNQPTRGAFAHKLPVERFSAAEESLADAALLNLFKLRDMLVARDANSLACEIDRVMERLERVSRRAVRFNAETN